MGKVHKLFKHQDEFLYSEAKHTGLVGGFGSGKSFIGTLKTVSKKIKYPGVSVAYYLPTYALIRDIAVPRFYDLLNAHDISYKYSSTNKEFETPFGKIILRSMDSPEYIIGYEVGYSLIDECDTMPLAKMKDCYVRIVARNRTPLPDGMHNCLDFVSSPEGFNFMYQFFVKENTPNKLLIKGKTSDNHTLPKSYIETLKEGYSEQEIESYLNGEFVNLTSGTVFNEFNRLDCHSDEEVKKDDILHVGVDFNITKMSAVVHVFRGGVMHAVDELTDIYDTHQMCIALREKYNNRIVVYPDASGRNRKTSGKSDFNILKDHGFKVIAPSKNPLVRDRVNNANKAFREGKYLVNTNQCIEYTEALERLNYRGGVPDKQSGFDHICDAATYFIYNQIGRRKGTRAIANGGQPFSSESYGLPRSQTLFKPRRLS